MRRAAVIFLLLLTVAVCLHVALVKHPNNYQVYITAAGSLLEGQNPYAHRQGLDFFKYSPLAALMMIPFSLLQDEVGTFIFVFFQYWLFFWGFQRWAKTVGLSLDQSKLVVIIAFCSVFTDVTLSVQICQVNAAIFGLMLLASAQYIEGKLLKSGLVLALATNIKLFPFTLALCLMTDLKKKFWSAFWLGLGLWFALPGVLLGFGRNLKLLQEWSALMHWDQTRNLEMLDLGNFLELHFGIPQSIRNPLAVFVGFGIGFASFWLFRKGWKNGLHRFLLPVNGLYILLFSYLSESATSILASTSIFLIGMAALSTSRRAWIYWSSWVMSLLLIPVFYSDIVPRAWLLWARAFHLKTVGYIFLTGIVGWLFFRLWKENPPPPIVPSVE
ncbi:MAG: DUF2029 domain-containing protein [Candidatus Aminicenantes bacterium]|nr:DUF2029 domain-containing protein [Candidatus Aminicenantes bacterium]